MRDVTTAQANALAAKVKYVGLLCEVDYSPTPVRVWTGRGNITWDGKTWAGIGRLGGISAIQEKVGARAGNMTLKINGVPSENLESALADTSQGREVKIWAATFTVAGGVWTIIDAPVLLQWGETDVHEIIEDDGSNSIEVSVPTMLARIALLQVLRYNNADQQRLFPGDRFFEFTEQVANQTLYWPYPEPQGAGTSGTGGSRSSGVTALS